MAIQRPADARPVAAHAFRPGSVEKSLSDGTLTFLDQKAAD